MNIKFPHISPAEMLERLNHPEGKIKMVLDTDTYNEIDDQYAVVYTMLSKEKFDVQAIYAAPFFNSRSTGAGDGMQKSYDEIIKLFGKLGFETENFVFKGSDRFLGSTETPVDSPAVQHLLKLVNSLPNGELLYVVAIGAITNIASAILINPEIIKKIVVVWLGGQPFNWEDVEEFNLSGDLLASQVIFDCDVPFIMMPCDGVSSHLTTTVAEVEKFIKNTGAVGDYLYEILKEATNDGVGKSRVIWDLAPLAWLINPEFMRTEVVHRPILTNERTYSNNNHRNFMRVAYYTWRDGIFHDLFTKIKNQK